MREGVHYTSNKPIISQIKHRYRWQSSALHVSTPPGWVMTTGTTREEIAKQKHRSEIDVHINNTGGERECVLTCGKFNRRSFRAHHISCITAWFLVCHPKLVPSYVTEVSMIIYTYRSHEHWTVSKTSGYSTVSRQRGGGGATTQTAISLPLLPQTADYHKGIKTDCGYTSN